MLDVTSCSEKSCCEGEQVSQEEVEEAKRAGGRRG